MDTTNILRFVSLDYLLQSELRAYQSRWDHKLGHNPLRFDKNTYLGESASNYWDNIIKLCENTND